MPDLVISGFMQTVLDDADQATAQTTLGVAVADLSNVTVSQTGAGAVNRPVVDKIRDVVHVSDYAAGTLAAAITGAGRSRPILGSDGLLYVPGPVIVDPDDIFTTTMLPPISQRRGGLFVLTDPAGADMEAGESASAQFWVGANPTATPGAGDSVAVSIFNVNGKGRGSNGTWGLDCVAVVANLGPGFDDSVARSAEFEIMNGFAFTESDPFGGGLRKNGVEIVGHVGSVGKITAALTTWANDTSGSKWFDQGLVLSRIASKGLRFVKNPGGATDTGTAFSVAAIIDESDSNAVLAASGTHASFFDLSMNPSYSQFIRGRSNAQTILNVKNYADHDVVLALDSGQTGARNSALDFTDRGSVKWRVTKNNGNGLFVISDPLGSPVTVAVFAPGGGGALGIGAPPEREGLDLAVGQLRVRTPSTPASMNAPGRIGEYAWDADYLYICIATNSWRRVAHEPW
jgi:hypothetical protein